jgi:hypothetical protein
VYTARVAVALGPSPIKVTRCMNDGILLPLKTGRRHRTSGVADVASLVREATLPHGPISKRLPQPRDVDLSTRETMAAS